MSGISHFLKVAALPRMPAYKAVASAAAPAAAAAAKVVGPATDQAMARAFGRGELGAGLLPQHLAVQGVEEQAHRAAAQVRLDKWKATGADARAASTPEREAKRLEMAKRTPSPKGTYDQGAYDANMAYARMPHSKEHHEMLAKKKAPFVEAHNDVVTKGRQAANEAASTPLPQGYDPARARAGAQFDMANTWHKNAPMVGALGGAAAGALTADTRETNPDGSPRAPDSRLTRALVGGGAGLAAGHGVKFVAPHVAGRLG